LVFPLIEVVCCVVVSRICHRSEDKLEHFQVSNYVGNVGIILEFWRNPNRIKKCKKIFNKVFVFPFE
jgi:hypothetical protein